jgi:hypothetical protein
MEGRAMWAILTGEFFWGIVVGLILSFIGGWAQAKITVTMQQKAARKTVVRFCIDTIKNIQGVIAEMDKTRDRARAIHHDFLTLIEVEIQIYGRNREHLIHLPDELRTSVREFMNDVAIKRAEVANKLSQFYQLTEQASQLQTQGLGPQAERVKTDALAPLGSAQAAADKLVTISKDGGPIVEKLALLK